MSRLEFSYCSRLITVFMLKVNERREVGMKGGR